MDTENKIKELETKLQEYLLKLQQVEERLSKLENGDFGTGIYLAGCTEADAEYIAGKPIKKVGE